MQTNKDGLADYTISLNAIFGEETIEVVGVFFEKQGHNYRKKIYNKRYLKHNSPNRKASETDFTSECYDAIFPDDPLSHCRRLGNIIAMNTICSIGYRDNKLDSLKPKDDNN